MRAFAKFLEIDQSLLSKIMRGQRILSPKNALKIGAKLGVSPSLAKSWVRTKSSKKGKETFLSMSDDEFNFLSDWYHFAILELAKTTSFKPEAKTIAKRLGIHVDEARAAVERLCRLGIVRIEDGRWYATAKGYSWFNDKFTSEPRRRLQKGFLERGLDAIENIPFHLRENGALTVAIDRGRLGEFKEKLKQVRQELGEFFQSDGELDEVYQLTISFFPLTRIEGGQQ
jgi:uncharacterized protein (TIGR02147 family)